MSEYQRGYAAAEIDLRSFEANAVYMAALQSKRMSMFCMGYRAYVSKRFRLALR